MAKRLRYCVDNCDEAMTWLQLQRVGYPRAQDFEPTGHARSDPTGTAGTLKGGDRAAATLEEFRRRMNRAFEAICWMEATIAKNLHAERPKFDPTDPAEYCRMHLQLDEYLYRYRGDRCRSCYDRVLALRDNGLPDDITVEDLRYHRGHLRWPARAVDPKAPNMKQPLPPPQEAKERRIAGLDNLLDGLTDIKEA